MHIKRFAIPILVLPLIMQWLPAAAAEVKYFPLPAGEHPHDVAPAPDGTVWYTGQRSGVLGRLDPKRGAVERIPLGKDSAPHGVIIGPDGAPWITDGGQNAIVRVDPISKDVKVWPLPPSRAGANLNTAAFDGEGRIWFTGQTGTYGRLDPSTGKMDVWDAPRGIGPYVDDKDKVWVSDFGANAILSFDPTSERFETFPSDKREGAVRQLNGRPGEVWGAESGTDRLVVIRTVGMRN